MPLKSFLRYTAGRTREQSERFVRAAYFGLLHRLPESSSLTQLSSQIMNGLSYGELLESILKSPEFMRRVEPDKLNDFLISTNSLKTQQSLKSLQFSGSTQKFMPGNLVYFCPAISWPLGGVKVITQHSQLINSEKLSGFSSEIFFPDDPDFHLDWFKNNAKIKREPKFNREQDIIIIPEIWALKYGSILIDNKINYAIFVQNGYYIFNEIYKGHLPSLLELKRIYNSASFILSVSDDTSACIQEAFEIPKESIYKVKPTINCSIFRPKKGKKKNIISYMPRKLSLHADWIINQLTINPQMNWEVLPIDGADEETVAKALSTSKIFLSFSDREGFSMPPLEASLCGNSVIGYTGEGAKEYWNTTLFKEVESGNLQVFLQTVLDEIKLLSDHEFLDIETIEKIEALDLLRNRYSSEQEAMGLSETLDSIKISKFG